MSKVDTAPDGANAVKQFAAALRAQPDQIEARLNGHDGMAGLCAVEAAISALWPPTTSKELVWLTRSEAAVGEVLHLQARAADGEVIGAATFHLTGT